MFSTAGRPPSLKASTERRASSTFSRDIRTQYPATVETCRSRCKADGRSSSKAATPTNRRLRGRVALAEVSSHRASFRESTDARRQVQAHAPLRSVGRTRSRLALEKRAEGAVAAVDLPHVSVEVAVLEGAVLDRPPASVPG